MPADRCTISRGSRSWCLTLPIGLCLAQSAPALAQSTLIDLPTSRPALAIITRTTDQPSDSVSEETSPMLLALDGVIARLATPKEIDELRRCLGAPIPQSAPATTESVRWGVVHLLAASTSDKPHTEKPAKPGDRRAGEHRALEVLRGIDGSWLLQELLAPSGTASSSSPRRVQLKAERFAPLVAQWSIPPQGNVRAQALVHEKGGPQASPAALPVIGQVFTLDKPYTAGIFPITRAIMGERLRAGQGTSLSNAARVLKDETLYCRLPVGWSDKSAYGLLVWVQAAPSGKLREELFEACDKLGFIVVGADKSGNDRPVQERYQLALDAVATIQDRYLIDNDRVYISGISGGGRVSSLLIAGFPDVFHGSVPIVGLSCYEALPTGDGKFWPAGFSKPHKPMFDLLKSRRIAPITGDSDFNQPEMLKGAAVFARDACQLRLFSYPDMGHHMPTPARFLEALTWVDAPAQARAAKRLLEAQAALDTYLAAHPHPASGEVANPKQRAQLEAITALAPWTEPAWKAVDLLRPAK